MTKEEVVQEIKNSIVTCITSGVNAYPSMVKRCLCHMSMLTGYVVEISLKWNTRHSWPVK